MCNMIKADEIDFSIKYHPRREVFVIKKDGTLSPFNINKVIKAIGKSAYRALTKFTVEEQEYICQKIINRVDDMDTDKVHIQDMHNMVEQALDDVKPAVAKSYRDYRNYKQDFVVMMDDIYKKAQSIMFIGDKENANSDSALVSTKRALIFNQINKELYQKFFMTTEELQACRDGYIYIHDMSSRRDTMNCDLPDIATILKGGFEMGNVWYNEPNSLDTAFDVIGDVTLSGASQQYGGFTICEVDKILEPYAQKSYNKYVEELRSYDLPEDKVEEIALKKVERDFDQGFQGWEYKFNTVGSSRGDYPFITTTFGLSTTKFGKMCNKSILKVRAGGQGKPGFKKPVLFPKLVFLYDENLHGEGKECEDVFLAGIDCSSKTMYPDYLSLTGEGYVASIYQQYGRVISPMGCLNTSEIVTYKFNGRLYVESIGRMWEKMAFMFPIKEQRYEGDPNLYIDLQGVTIYDTNIQGFTPCNRIIRNVSDKWVDVSLAGGRRILVTNDHPFEVMGKGVVKAENLQIGDQMMVNYSQYSEENYVVDPEYAWTLGFMLCDGCYQNYSVFASIAAHDEDEIEERFKTNMAKYFGANIVTINQNRGVKGVYKDLRAKSQGNNELTTMIDEFTDLYGGVNKIKRQIPNEVFEWNYASKLAFLAGMIDADGYIDDRERISIVRIGSTNKELALQQLALAQALGMPAKMYHNHYTKRNPEAIRYQVSFHPSVDLGPYIACAKKKRKAHLEPIRMLDQEVYEEKTYAPIGSVNGIRPIFNTDYSYDVSTDSEHFEASGIYTHNCRAFLSPWYERGGMKPADEDDKPIFVGRGNIGVVSLHLPMILAKSRQENRDFYEVLDYYLEMIRQLHLRTYEYLGEMRASTNPLMYCNGGFLGGNLDFHDKIKPVLKSFTASFGITALNELNRLYNGKSIAEDGEFPLEVMKHINDKINEYKQQDGRLYAIYGTPAESLCGLQIKQFRAKYGIIENVSDREYVSNSFHCHVSENITPIQKQDIEEKFWELFNGGKIQYVRYPIPYNKEAIISLVRRAMKKGYYEGVNMSLAYCDDCGHQELEMDVCPVCGSKNLTKIDRMNGYLAYSRVHGDTRLNAAKMEELKERKSM